MSELRAQVLEGLLQVTLQGRSAQDVLPGFTLLPDADRRLAFELFYGSLHHYFELQARVKNRLNRPLKKSDADLAILMILGMYQIAYTRIPEHAALNETVDLCHFLDKPWATKLVNAVLRRFQRDHEAGKDEQLTTGDKVNLPNWLFKTIAEDWPEQADAIYLASHERAPTTLRINTRQISIADYHQALTDADVDGAQHPYHKQAINFARVGDITKLPGYEQGWFSIQDGAAQFAAGFLDVAPGERVLDACAAPGGKTSHILELADDSVTVVALDNVAARLDRVRENLQRLQLNADIRQGDALYPEQWQDDEPQLFDKILLDAPCSATGIIRRHPDIALHRRPKDIRVLTQLQWRLLKTLWGQLKAGGVLLYSTCSIVKAENAGLINDFLKQNPDAQLLPFTTPQGSTDTPGMWQILPGEAQMDGFFYARLQKQA